MKTQLRYGLLNLGCLLCHNNSHIPNKKLRDIMDIIAARHSDIENKWLMYFKKIRYYC
jgi:hypothetical protein